MTNKDIFRELGGLNAHTVLDAAPDKPVGAPVWLRIAAAAACAVLILAGALAAPHLLPDTPSLPTDSSSNPTTQPITQPLTPPVTEPQKPVFNTVVRPLSLATPSDGGSLPISVYHGTFTFAFESEQPFVSEEHRKCIGVCYGANDDVLFCATCALKERLEGTNGINTTNITVIYFSPAQNKVLFYSGKKAYIYDFATGALQSTKLDPAKVFPTVSEEMTEDEGAYALVDGIPGYWLVNLSTAEIVQVAKAGKDGKDYPTSDGMTRFSNGRKYVCYVLADGEVYPTKITTVFLNLETRERTLVKGSMMDGTPDDRYFTMQTEDGLMVFDTEKNAVVPFEGSGIPEVYRYSLKITEPFYEVGGSAYKQLSVIDLLTGKTVHTLDGYASAYAQSADRRFIYAYVRDESALRVIDLATMQEGIAPLEEDFLERMADPEYALVKVLFDMSVRASDGAVLLTYRSTLIERKTIEDLEAALEEYRKQQALSPYSTFKGFLNDGKFISIASLGEVLEKHPDAASYMIAFEGDGYMYVYYNVMFAEYVYDGLRFGSSPMLAFEDYRTNEFNIIRHAYSSDLMGAFSADGDCYTMLKPSAQAETRAMLEKYGVPTRTAEIDYAKYIKNGKLLHEEMIEYAYSLEHIIGHIQSIRFEKTVSSDSEFPEGTKTERDSFQSIAKAEEFVRFADSFDLAEHDEYHSLLEWPKYQYGVIIYAKGEEVFPGLSPYSYAEYRYSIGMQQGKPYIEKAGYKFYISQEEYDYWIEWFASEFLAQYK